MRDFFFFEHIWYDRLDRLVFSLLTGMLKSNRWIVTVGRIFSSLLVRQIQINILCVCGLNNTGLSSHTSGGWRTKINMLAGLVSPAASLLGLQLATLSPYSHLSLSGLVPLVCPRIS